MANHATVIEENTKSIALFFDRFCRAFFRFLGIFGVPLARLLSIFDITVIHLSFVTGNDVFDEWMVSRCVGKNLFSTSAKVLFAKISGLFGTSLMVMRFIPIKGVERTCYSFNASTTRFGLCAQIKWIRSGQIWSDSITFYFSYQMFLLVILKC